MGLFDSIFNGLKNNANEMRNLREKYENYSDSRLIHIFKNGSFTEKAVALEVLKTRYSESEIKSMINNY